MKLIPNARKAWRFLSMQAMAAALLLNGAWLGLPVDLRGALPAWVPPVMAIAILGLGMLGRLVVQTDKKQETDEDEHEQMTITTSGTEGHETTHVRIVEGAGHD